MTRSASEPSTRSSALRNRALLAGFAIATAGVVGFVEHVGPYDVRVDIEGVETERIPPGSIAIVHDTAPEVGDVAAYNGPDDLDAGRVVSINEHQGHHFYAVGYDGGTDQATATVTEHQMEGRLVAHAEHVGTPWTLPTEAKVAIQVLLVAGYLGVGAYRSPGPPSGGSQGPPGGVRGP